MKYYAQYNSNGEPAFDVVWGQPLEEDDSLAIVKWGKVWSLLDIVSGLHVVTNLKTKKAVLEWYYVQRATTSLVERIKNARNGDHYKKRVEAMQKHRILHTGDRCTYIDVKDSVIFDLIIYSNTKDKWLVKDEWHQFEVSPDRIIKVSEVQ